MIINGRGLIKALENWAKKVTSGYRDVDVRDLSTSFRDGMAFCAIIHHYRPDLIDFDSLFKANIFENSSLAFSVAEKQLGVPALLDAEDMVKYAQPDRLSIITYLSQLRNCFENQNKVNLKKPELKRIQQSTPGPPAKISAIEPALIPIKRHEVCQVCKHRVFILERLIVDGKLYHTTCFRCHKCDSLLNPGAYIESDDTPGLYECSVCLKDEVPESPKMFVKAPKQLKEREKANLDIHVLKPQELPQKDFTSKEAVSFAKSNLLLQEKTNGSQTSHTPNLLRSVSTKSPEIAHKIANSSESSVSVKDKINVFEKNQTIKISPTTPVNKLRNSFLSSTPNELPLNQPSRFSEQNSIHLENESASCAKSSSEEMLFSFKKSINDEISTKKLEEVEAGVSSNCDNTSNSESFPKEPHLDRKNLPSQTEDAVSCSKSAYSTRTVSESPRISRDIFKSSMQPLKLSIASIRKDQTNSQDTSSEFEKTFDIPQIKSNYSITLPRSGFSRNLSLQENPISIKSSNSESNIINNAMLQKESKLTRRSSFESASEGDGNKQVSGENVVKSGSISFNRTISAQDMNTSTSNNIRSPLRTYTPIYRSMLSSLSLDSHIISTKSDTDSLKHDAENKDISIDNADSAKPKNEINEFVESKILSVTPVSKSSLLIKSEKLHDDKIKQATNNLKITPSTIPAIDSHIQESNEEYPDDLNPFGDEETNEKKDDVYPDDLNPFGDEDEEINTSEFDTSKIKDYDESKNPFASDEEEDETASTLQLPSLSPKPSLFENKSPSFQDSSICSNLSSPSSSLKGTLKKRPAPKPPAISDIFKESGDSGVDSSFSSLKSSPSSSKRNFQSSSPKIRKNKPAPPPPAMTDSAASIKMAKESDNLKLKSSAQNAGENQSPKQTLKKKKRPAPPVPIPMRRDMKKIPLKEIIQEMKEIEEKQREYERQGREIELLIRDKDKDEEASVEEEEYIMQLFELVNQKNALFRRQAELMYIKRSQRLEEQQCQIEKSIRILMEKPDSEKTDEDREEEDRLTIELIDIVDQRNSIIDSIEMDRRRELEEDHSVQEQLEMKNGDLPIPAELKEKNGKKKKDKKKKDKKKQEEQESGKGTLRKKKLFSKKS